MFLPEHEQLLLIFMKLPYNIYYAEILFQPAFPHIKYIISQCFYKNNVNSLDADKRA